MKYTVIACLILATWLLSPGPAQAQSTAIQAHNAFIMDSLQMEVLTVWCQGKIDSPQTYNRHKTRELAGLLQSISSLYDDSLTRTALFTRLKHFHDCRISTDSTSLGGLHILTVFINMEKFLRARLQFSCIGDFVVAQRYELQPVTLYWCTDHSQGFFDFDFCKTVYPGNISFPLRYARHEFFYAARLSPVNRQAAAAANPQYAPFLAMDSTGNANDRLLTDAYFESRRNTYTDRPDAGFVDLARTVNIPVLTGLLYSPSYYYAINAMEALIYLEATHQFSADVPLLQRIDQLKKAATPISQAHFDVVRIREGYSALGITDQQVIAKYRNALAASAK